MYIYIYDYTYMYMYIYVYICGPHGYEELFADITSDLTGLQSHTLPTTNLKDLRNKVKTGHVTKKQSSGQVVD